MVMALWARQVLFYLLEWPKSPKMYSNNEKLKTVKAPFYSRVVYCCLYWPAKYFVWNVKQIEKYRKINICKTKHGNTLVALFFECFQVSVHSREKKDIKEKQHVKRRSWLHKNWSHFKYHSWQLGYQVQKLIRHFRWRCSIK